MRCYWLAGESSGREREYQAAAVVATACSLIQTEPGVLRPPQAAALQPAEGKLSKVAGVCSEDKTRASPLHPSLPLTNEVLGGARAELISEVIRFLLLGFSQHRSSEAEKSTWDLRLHHPSILEKREGAAGVLPPLIVGAELIECVRTWWQKCLHTRHATVLWCPAPGPDLAAGSPPPGRLCSQKTIVLVRWGCILGPSTRMLGSPFRTKTAAIQYLPVTNLSVNITHELINLNFAFGPSGTSASRETKNFISVLFLKPSPNLESNILPCSP